MAVQGSTCGILSRYMAVHGGTWHYFLLSITVYGSTWRYKGWICAAGGAVPPADFRALLKALHCLHYPWQLPQVIASTNSSIHALVLVCLGRPPSPGPAFATSGQRARRRRRGFSRGSNLVCREPRLRPRQAVLVVLWWWTELVDAQWQSRWRGWRGRRRSWMLDSNVRLFNLMKIIRAISSHPSCLIHPCHKRRTSR